MINIPIKHLWQADDYYLHSSVQNDAAMQLLQKIGWKGHEQILDVGCGDGKITARIAKNVPRGSVIGLDASPEMIDFAKKSFSRDRYPNLTYVVQDAQEFDFNGKLDLIFSSFALQWLPQPHLFFKCACNSLKSTGIVVATIPLGISDELDKAIEITISSPQWSSYFQSFSPKWNFQSGDEYKRLLIENNFIVNHFDVVSQTVVFHSREEFENYVIQWFSYLQGVPQELKQTFFQEVIDRYLDLNPLFDNGKVSFKFLRVDLIAEKSKR